MKSLLHVFLAASLLLPACGGDDDDDDDTIDAAVQFDAPATIDSAPVDIDAESWTCEALETYGTPDLSAGQAFVAEQSSNPGKMRVQFLAELNDNAQPDVVFIELWEGYGAFTSTDFAPGSYTIAGDETDLQVCGVCVYVLTDVVQTSSGLDYSQSYIAESGTVEFTALGRAAGEAVTGSLSGISLKHVDWSGSEQVDVPSGCTSEIESASFDATLQAPG